MQFESEAALQAYCLDVLKAKGIEAQEEVWTEGIRADIITPDCVYELKKVLNRETLYQALGQATAYNQSLNRNHICIVGQSPTDTAEFQQAIKIAKAISNDVVRVSFIDHDSFWNLEHGNLFDKLRMKASSRMRAMVKEAFWMLAIGVVGALMICAVVNLFYVGQESPNPGSDEFLNEK